MPLRLPILSQSRLPFTPRLISGCVFLLPGLLISADLEIPVVVKELTVGNAAATGGVQVELKNSSDVLLKDHILERMTGRWHVHANIKRVGAERSLEYDGIAVGKFLAGTTFFQMDTETFMPNGQRISSTSIQFYDSGSETYRMIEHLGDKMLVEMVGRVSGQEIIWKPMHGVEFEIAENVVHFIDADRYESRTDMQITPESPKIVVLTQYERIPENDTSGVLKVARPLRLVVPDVVVPSSGNVIVTPLVPGGPPSPPP